MATITKSIGTSSRDYSTITLWEAALGGAAGGAGNDAIGECYNDSGFSETVSINDATPDSIVLTAATGEEHDGTAGTGVENNISAGNITISTSKPTSISLIEMDQCGLVINAGSIPFLRANRMLIHNIDDNPLAGITIASVLFAGDTSISNNIIYAVHRTVASGQARYGIFGETTRPILLQNNTVHDIKHENAGSSGDAIGIYQQDITNSKNQNNIVTDVTTPGSGAGTCFDPASYSNATGDHNMSSDGTAFGTGSVTGVTTADQYVSIVEGSEDLHIKTGSDAIGAGTDLGTTPTGVNIDINGRDRDSEGDTWDIGAHQLVSAPPTGRPLPQRVLSGPFSGPLNGVF